MPTIQVKESQIATRSQRRKFLLLLGRQALEQATNRLGLKRIGPQEKFKQISNKLESPDTSDSEAQELIEEFHEASEGLKPNMDEDISVEVAVPKNKISNSEHFHSRFMDLFDDEKMLMNVLGIPEERQEISKENYFKLQDAVPYKTRVTETKAELHERVQEQKANRKDSRSFRKEEREAREKQGIQPINPEEVG